MALSAQQISVYLTEARAAYHDLVTGRSARVVVESNGERVEFVAANRQQLYVYIQQLEAQLIAAATTAADPVTGPMQFIF